MAKQPGVRIRPRIGDPARCKPSKVEILSGIKDLPEFVKLDDRHWSAIYAMWDISAATGKPASAKAIAEAAGVNIGTIRSWRAREDFLRASEMVKLEVLHEWTPVLLHAGLKKAAEGNNQMLKLFLEQFILPSKKESGEGPDTEINISWGDAEKIPSFPTDPPVPGEVVEPETDGDE